MRRALVALAGPIALTFLAAPARVARADGGPTSPAEPSAVVGEPQVATEKPPPPPPRKHAALPWIITGIGAGVAAFGVLSFVGAVKARSDVKSEAAAKHCGLDPTVCPAGVDASNIDKNASGAKAMDIFGAAFTGVGGAAIAGGLLWHFLEPVGPAPGAAALRVSPWVGRGGGLIVEATF